FQVDTNDQDFIELRAREHAQLIGKHLKELDDDFKNARIYQYAHETSLFLKNEIRPEPFLSNHHVLEANADEISYCGIQLLDQKCLDFIKHHKTPAASGDFRRL